MCHNSQNISESNVVVVFFEMDSRKDNWVSTPWPQENEEIQTTKTTSTIATYGYDFSHQNNIIVY